MFHERLRTSLLNLYISKEKRSQLDARNTVAAPPSFYEQASQLYNDSSWIPQTWLFPAFDSRLRVPICLPLEKDNSLTPENMKDQLNEARAQFKKVYARWKTSGNGSGNHKKIIRIRGTNYEDDGNTDEEEIVSVEDDRADFCNDVGIHIGYFWCVTEMFSVNQFMTQDCTGIGLTSTSNYLSLEERVKNRNKKKRQRMSKQEKAVEHIESLTKSVLTMVNEQKKTNEIDLDIKVEEKLSKKLRNAEECLLSFQEREEAIFDQLDRIQMNENVSEDRIKYMKARHDNMILQVSEKEKSVDDCKQSLIDWEKSNWRSRRNAVKKIKIRKH